MRLARFSVVAVAALGVVAGCGSDNSGSSSGGGATETAQSAKPAGKAAATVAVSETEYKLDPASPKVAKAGTVEFKVTNDGKIVHALEIEGPSGEAKTASIQPGKSATLKADLGKPGSYEWYCPIDGHKQKGMKGTISVAGGGSGGATTTDDSGGGGGGNGGY